MRRVSLGKTGIETSYMGIGTSAAYEGAVCPAKLKASDYEYLLPYAYDKGITLWDTSMTYGTHSVVKNALKSVGRSNIAICTKTIETSYRKTVRAVEAALAELGTDYIDIFLLQCMRSRFDFTRRKGAFDAVHDMKEKGYIRGVGIASHGLGALEASVGDERLDVVLGRVNYSGHLMDSRQDDIRSLLAGIPLVKKLASTLLPSAVFKSMASSVQKDIASGQDREYAISLLEKIHNNGTGVIGMKVLGEGNLAFDVPKAVSYVQTLPFISAIVLGCCSKSEMDEAVEAFKQAENER